jgi:dissimilatory sulfite reductase alpha subunit
MFQGISTENVQKAFDGLNEMGFDLGGAGPALRTSMSCVGAARCEMSCFDEARALRTVINNNLDDMHRPSLPYKFKFKFSGCPNDCVNAIQRSDMATIGTWRDNIRVDEKLVQDYYQVHGMHDLYNDVVGRCPTKAITLPSGEVKAGPHTSGVCAPSRRRQHPVHRQQELRALHALPERHPRRLAARQGQGRDHPGRRQGRAEDRRHHGHGDHPVHEAGTDEDFEKLNELARNVLDFFAENALDHERTGEMIERIGLANFLEGMDIPVDPNMISQPRSNPYFRGDDWDEQVAKWIEYKQQAA